MTPTVPETPSPARHARRVLLSLLVLGFAAAVVMFVAARLKLRLSSAQHPPINPDSILSSPGQFITLDPSGTFLVNSITGKPVFLVGDSAWSLITQLNDADVEVYLASRASHGFNYIWCAAADNYYQSNAPRNRNGDVPFDGPDFTNPDPHYWQHVDHVLQRAATYGITVALDPGFVGLTAREGHLTSYQKSSAAVLGSYGAFLGDRYKGAPNLIWALGGDLDPKTGVIPKITALATGIRSKDKVHLLVAEGEPQHAALDTFAGATWMNLNWLYFHTTNVPSGVASNERRSPWIPSFQGEGWYENEHSMTPLQLREQAYWAVLSGASLGNAGFGNDPTWYFNGGPQAHPEEPAWTSQLDSPGSLAQMYLGKLFRSREHWKLVADLGHTVMTAGFDSRTFISSTRETVRSLVRQQPYRMGDAPAVAARTSNGHTVIAYIPTGNASTITIAMDSIADPGSQAKSWWFDPRSGSSTLIGIQAAHGTLRFTPPDSEDWVLVIDSLAANLPAPGSQSR